MTASASPHRLPHGSRLLIGLTLSALIAGGSIAAWRLRSDPVQHHLAQGAEFLRQGRGLDAEREWREAVRLDPNNAEAWKLLGEFHFAAQSWAEARAAFVRVRELEPQTPGVESHLAVAAARLGDHRAALPHAEAAVRQNPGDVTALMVLVDSPGLARTPSERLKHLQKLIELQPQNFEYLAKTADLLTTRRRYDEAKPLIDRLLSINPNFAPAFSMRGEAHLEAGTAPDSLRLAERDLQKALSLDPRLHTARHRLGKAYIRQRQFARAIRELETLHRANLPNKAYLLDLATAYQRAGQGPKAAMLRRRYAELQRITLEIDALQQRLERTPNNFEGHLQLAALLLQSETPVGVERHLRKALHLRPGDARARAAMQQLERMYARHLQNGLAALARRDTPAAGRHLGKALQLRPRDPRTRAAAQRLAAASGVELPAWILELTRPDAP